MRAEALEGQAPRELDPRRGQDVRAVARMHLELLSWGPMAGLGLPFLEGYCYRVLVGDGLMQAALAEVDGEPAGFVVYTARPGGFLSQALRRHPWRAAAALLASLAARPQSLLKLGRAVSAPLFHLSGRGAGLPAAEGEILAIGVRPQYRSLPFLQSSGRRIGRELFSHVVSRLRAAGRRSLQMDVDAFNREALLFYHALGGRFQAFRRGKDPMYRILFEL
jgi:ribosomal protein S18 acetylase RimI-like enzyme